MVTVKDDELFKGLFNLMTDIHYVVQKTNHQHGGFRGQGRIIHLLAHQEQPLMQSKLAALAQIQPGSLTQLLEKMERDHLIERQRSQTDRRSVKVQLTDRGRQLYIQIIKQRSLFEQQMLEGISEDEQQQFIAVLNKLDQNLHKYHELNCQSKGDSIK